MAGHKPFSEIEHKALHCPNCGSTEMGTVEDLAGVALAVLELEDGEGSTEEARRSSMNDPKRPSEARDECTCNPGRYNPQVCDPECPVHGSEARCGTEERVHPIYEGWTEVDWDSSTTVGYACRACHTQYVGPDWKEVLLRDQ